MYACQCPKLLTSTSTKYFGHDSSMLD